MKFILSLFFCLAISITSFAGYTDKPMAQSFTGSTMDGQNFSLEDFRGKVVVLTFWSTRCAICEKEIPKFNQMATKYSGKNVVFLGLTMENEVKVAEHLKKKPFNFTIVPNSLGIIMKYADQGANGSFNIAYPTMFVINQKGEIELKADGRDKSGAIDSKISTLLSK